MWLYSIKRNDSRQEKVKDVYYENDDTVLLKEDNNPKLYYNNSIHEELDATINLDEKLRNADSPNFTAGNFYNNNTKNESASPHFTENGYNMPQSYGNRKKSGAEAALITAGCIIAVCAGIAAGIIFLNLFFIAIYVWIEIWIWSN